MSGLPLSYPDFSELETSLEGTDKLHFLHKRCWTSGNLNRRAVGEYTQFVLDNILEDWVKTEDIFYARIYLEMFERKKSRQDKEERQQKMGQMGQD